MGSKRRYSLSLALAVALSASLAPLVTSSQSPASTSVTAAAAPLGTWFVVQDDAALSEESPAVAYNSVRQEYLVVWFDDRAGNDDVRAQRLAADGTLLGGPFYVAAGVGADRYWPGVTYNSGQDEYLVVWQQQDTTTHLASINARRVSASGQVLGAGDIAIRSEVAPTSRPGFPVASYAGVAGKYLVVWTEQNYATSTMDVMGQVLVPDGSLAGGAFTISDDTTGDSRWIPALAYNHRQNEYLVTWLQRDKASGLFTGIYARRVTADGTPLNPPATEVMLNASGLSQPAVAAIPTMGGDGQYLVAATWATSATTSQVRARLVSGTGALLPTFDVSMSSNTAASGVAVAGWDARQRYMVAWEQGADPPLTFRYVVGRTLSASGGAPGPGYHLGGLSGVHPAMVAGAAGDFLTVFEDTPLGAGSSGVYARLYGERVYVPMALRSRR